MFTDKEWERVLEQPRKTSRNPKFKFIQLMILHRAYLTPYKLHKMFPETPDSCPRCQEPQAKLMYMIWACPKLAHYWSEVLQLLWNIVEIQDVDTPMSCILGMGSKGKKQGPGRKFLNLALLLAKRNITRKWKSAQPPKLEVWHKEVIKWGKAEGTELKREEQRGMRKKLISLDWNMRMEQFIAATSQTG